MAGQSVAPPQWKRRRGTISASGTSTIFQEPLSNFRSIKIIASFFNVTEDKTKQIEIGIINADGSISDRVNKQGSSMSLAIDSIIDGSDIKIEVTNNESYEMKYNYLFVIFRANF